MALPRLRRLITAASLSLMVAVTMTALPPSTANALSSDVVISAVYGGGGNSGAVFKNDYIELANLTGSPIDVSAWSVQYASAAGAVFQLTKLTGSIPAHGRYLVQEAAGAAGTVSLPTPDDIGTIPMSGTSGVVALVTSQTPLVGCGISCWSAPNVKDLVGYGATANVETLAAPALTNTTAVARTGALTDTDNNAADFVSGVPKATNSAGTTVTAGDPGDPGDPTPRHQTYPRHPGRGPDLPDRRAERHERAGHRHRRPGDGQLARLLVPGPLGRRRPPDQRGPLRLHRLDLADGRHRRLRPGLRPRHRVPPGHRRADPHRARRHDQHHQAHRRQRAARARPRRLPRRLHQERQPGGPTPGAVLVRAGLA
ncbi:lamin tail domain-containing protein [Streptosporangium vulgare]|uniref:lamin tail domain-containing protein n=1 Tax=Streptosporangium vulgare TaxID=46190 RepID=UPI0031D16C26